MILGRIMRWGFAPLFASLRNTLPIARGYHRSSVLAALFFLTACSSYSARDQQLIHVPAEHGAVAERASTEEISAAEHDIDVSAVREVIHRISSRGWLCFDFARSVKASYLEPYRPVPGDPVYVTTANQIDDDWVARDTQELELRCILYGQADAFDFEGRLNELETGFLDLMMSEPGSKAREDAALPLRELALDAELYGKDQPYLANLAIELTASFRLFKGQHGLSTCGQSNCRLLHRTCGRSARMRWKDQTNLRAFRILCELRRDDFLSALRSTAL